MQEIFLKISYFDGGLSKSLKKGILSFETSPSNGRDYENEKVSETSDQLLFSSQNNFRRSLLVTYYLTKFDVM